MELCFEGHKFRETRTDSGFFTDRYRREARVMLQGHHFLQKPRGRSTIPTFGANLLVLSTRAFRYQLGSYTVRVWTKQWDNLSDICERFGIDVSNSC